MGTGEPMAARKVCGRVPEGTQQHRDWLNLVDVTGPFLSIPVLRTAWPTLDALDKQARTALRQHHTNWQADPATSQPAWLHYVLAELLGWADELHWAEHVDLAPLAVAVPEHDTSIVPSFVLTEPGGAAKPDSIRLLGLVTPPGVHPTGRQPGDAWAASAADRLARLCRTRDIPLGLATDGRWWTLVWAQHDGATGTATFDAIGWADTAERDVVRAFTSLLSRHRFFGVPADETLPSLLEASKDSQEEITESLGVQAREAVELLVAAIGRADTVQRERGEPGITDISADTVYRGSVSVLMRIVFLLFAEERGMLPSDNELYATAYSAGRLCADLEAQALESSEDDLEHSHAAWHRLLALFEAVYWGIDHQRLWMYPHDGSLFDTTSHPWLPANIDDRTILHVLRAVQYVETGTGKNKERRKLSFRELDVEQIGYTYEGLLAYDAFRADEVYLGLTGKSGAEHEAPLTELEQHAAESADVVELAERIANAYRKTGIGTARGLARKLTPPPPAEREEQRQKLLAATRGDAALSDRLLPFANLIRRDLRGLPMVILPGELFVTESVARQDTGTHYTPRDLAERVVRDALEPLVYRVGPIQTADESRWVPKTADELLELNVADIAMGSGAFLVAAARYLGQRLVEAWARDGDDRAMAAKISRALGDVEEDRVVVEARRQVIEHCLYGVDINPTAVEIAKVSLWLVSMDGDKPFTFLDDRLKTGDSLLGVTSIEQVRTMHLDPAAGRDLHSDLFAWTESTQARIEKAADTRRRIAELPQLGSPLDWLDDKRKLDREAADDTADLRLAADTLIGALLARAPEGPRGMNRASIEAAHLANQVMRDGETKLARDRADTWLRADQGSIVFPRRPLHWPLVFVDVFDEGGFDAVVGNQPYLGGQKLTSAQGHAYREYLIHAIGNGVRGSADLVAYFVLRAHSLLKPTGQTGLIATNTLAQGDTREVGLDQVVAAGTTIRRATKSMQWPTKSAALECCIIATSREPLGDDADSRANGMAVPAITSSLDAKSRADGKPVRLRANQGIAFQGTNVLGLGFTMEPARAQELIAKDPANAEVLFPYLNGQDVNSRPDCSGSRWVINFHDWSEDRAREYPECYEQVLRDVKPVRDDNNRKVYRDYWWQYGEKRPAMVQAIARLERVVVLTRVSKTVMPAIVPTGQVISEAVVVLASDDMAMLALLSSGPHYWWAKSRGSSMKADLRYTPSDVFETFPLPEVTGELRELGERLDTYRRDVMLSRNAGLTKTYNLVFDSDCRDEDIEELRRIHREVDEAAIRAYGWEDRVEAVGGLDHGFHPVGRETRYTIGPAAQREILDSLLELNHERAAQEAETQPVRKSRPKRNAKDHARDRLL
ncbi:Methyltransferase domain [Prauserella sp. Am3]|nr:Methyltransferase domain [Prauserella sp. Am3]